MIPETTGKTSKDKNLLSFKTTQGYPMVTGIPENDYSQIYIT